MTEIAFHFNAPDKLAYACRLLRKAVGRGAPVMVTGDAGSLRALDEMLWTFSALDFLPHCQASAGPSLRAASPIVLGDDVSALPRAETLLNLGSEVPAGFERFERLIELVGADDADRGIGRRRWQHYAARGYAIISHDVASTKPN
ncbi:MAG: DNA polymerase III chi subunit [Burkholderiaceae bacterium]|jgi:DNA polymerase-3 subunit chi|nr:MAG: DNA polymerase III chi subunit [Burkholderiaceae bacterium]